MKYIFPKIIFLLAGFLSVFFGILYIGSAMAGITGFVISEETSGSARGFTGVFFIFLGLFFFSKARGGKKGQAAMEFLMTYGWAILAMIVAIGTLVYLGIFNTNGGNNIALLSPPLYAGAVSVNNGENGEQLVSFEVTNNGDMSIRLLSASIEGLSAGTCEETNLNNQIVSAGEKIIITIVCNNIDNEAGRLSVKYVVSGSTLPQYSGGTIALHPPSNAGQQGGSGGGDITPPIISLSSIGGDSNSPFSINDDTPDTIATTNENAFCSVSSQDVDYNSMSIACRGDVNGLYHECPSPIVFPDNLAQHVYVACIDDAENSNNAGNNLDATFELDTMAPVQSGWNPPDNSDVGALIYSESGNLYLDVSLSINENGRCKWDFSASPVSRSYSTMTEFCTNGNYAVDHTCKVLVPPVPDNFYVYTSCADDTDISPNEDLSSVELHYSIT